VSHRNRRIMLGLLCLTLLVTGCTLFNRTPVAVFTRTPDVGTAPLAVLFHARDSLDPDGEIVAYHWAFGDGEIDQGVEVTHVYESAGTYEAELTVVDDGGASNTTSKMVTIQDGSSQPEVGVNVGDRAPGFGLTDLFSGETVHLSDLAGYVVLLDFWGSWCPPCRTSMPNLESLRARFADQGLVLVGINVKDRPDDARAFLEQEGFTEMIALIDTPSQDTRWLYEVDLIPRTFLIDRQGIIRHIDHPIRFRDWVIQPWL